MNVFRRGERVVYVGVSNATDPQYYPPVGTIGVVYDAADGDPLVQWPAGSTSRDDLWFVYHKEIRNFPVDC